VRGNQGRSWAGRRDAFQRTFRFQGRVGLEAIGFGNSRLILCLFLPHLPQVRKPADHQSAGGGFCCDRPHGGTHGHLGQPGGNQVCFAVPQSEGFSGADGGRAARRNGVFNLWGNVKGAAAHSAWSPAPKVGNSVPQIIGGIVHGFLP